MIKNLERKGVVNKKKIDMKNQKIELTKKCNASLIFK